MDVNGYELFGKEERNESVLILAVKDRRSLAYDSVMPVSIQKADTMSAFL